ncbi:MAG: hypothetical protein ACTS4U_01570, partial [Candidatus Hodgkinia cicadicola]
GQFVNWDINVPVLFWFTKMKAQLCKVAILENCFAKVERFGGFPLIWMRGKVLSFGGQFERERRFRRSNGTLNVGELVIYVRREREIEDEWATKGEIAKGRGLTSLTPGIVKSAEVAEVYGS